jgi:hypothetical protein
MTNVQLVFIIDLDGTIIGDCSYQVMVQNIDNIAKLNKVKVKSPTMLSDSYKPDSKLIRPFFKYFISQIRSHYPRSLFYVYTASEKTWAHKEIAFIEKTHDFKFNRPIFTRNDCIKDTNGQYKKSVKQILPEIVKKNKNVMIPRENILVIDNNPVFIDYMSNFLLCPTYDYLHFCDIWGKINQDHMKIPAIGNMMNDLMISNKACRFQNMSNDSKTLEQKHKWMYKKYKKINSINRPFQNDIFWKVLTNAIISKKITEFDRPVMKFLASSISNVKQMRRIK